jgi:hypothetical protein
MPVDYQSATERFKIPAAVGEHVFFRESTHTYTDSGLTTGTELTLSPQATSPPRNRAPRLIPWSESGFG